MSQARQEKPCEKTCTIMMFLSNNLVSIQSFTCMKGTFALRCLALLLVFLFPILATAQPIFQQEYTFGNALPVAVESMSNHFYVAGTTAAPSAGGDDVCLMKTQADGTPVWSKVFGGQGNDRFLAMCRTQDGLLALLGTTTSFVSSGDAGNLYILVIDSAGNLRKSKSIDAGGSEVGYSIRETSGRGFILAGLRDSAGVSQPLLVQVDADLKIQWSRLYASADDFGQVARAAMQTSDGAYAFVGYGSPNSAPANTEMFIVVTGTDGAPVANRHFYDARSGYSNFGVQGYDLIQNTAGDLVAVGAYGGYYTMAFQDIYSPLMMVCDLNANVVYGRAYSHNSGNSSARSVRATPDGGYLIGGTQGNYYAYMTKTDAMGDKVWSYLFANASFSPQARGYSARNTPGGGFVIASSLSAGNKVRLIRTDAAGQSGCDQNIPSLGGGASPLGLPNAVHVWSSFPAPKDTVAAMTTVQTATINPSLVCGTVEADAAIAVPGLKLGPNPARDRVVVEASGADRLIVTNLLGETVFSSPMQALGTTRLTLDIAEWAAGLYLVRVGSTTQKLIKE
jgi:hypothetical protein